MTVPRLDAVGFCAHYSRQGDWAFEFALNLARSTSLQLNVFHFLDDPYDASYEKAPPRLSSASMQQAIQLEKEMRLYYDSKLGDYCEVGFRLCEDREWTELHKCLTKREFQVLVLARPSDGALFGGRPIEEFASAFVCPVVLVGPDLPRQYHLNRPAALMADRLGLDGAASSERCDRSFEIVDTTSMPTPDLQLGS
jgi:hypothetical protein